MVKGDGAGGGREERVAFFWCNCEQRTSFFIEEVQQVSRKVCEATLKGNSDSHGVMLVHLSITIPIIK